MSKKKFPKILKNKGIDSVNVPMNTFSDNKYNNQRLRLENSRNLLIK